MYENSLDLGGFFGDRQMEPICGYVSTGEVSTQFAGWEKPLKNGIEALATLITSVYNVLNGVSARAFSKGLNYPEVRHRANHGD